MPSIKANLVAKEAVSQVFMFGNLIMWSIPFYFTSPLRIFSRKYGVRMRNWWVRKWIKCNTVYLNKILGMQLRCHGLENIPEGSSFVILMDHHSWADIPTIFEAFKETCPRFTFKEVLKYIPFLGWTMLLLDHVPLKRAEENRTRKLSDEEKRRNLEEFQRCLNALRDEETPFSFVVFAPGTRWQLEKLHAAQEESNQKGYPVYQSVLTPKAGALTQLLEKIHPLIDGIVLANIAYTHNNGDRELNNNTKSSRFFYQGGFKSVDLFLEWIPKEQIPAPAEDGYYEDVKTWLLETWKRVDERLTRFVETGRFS